MADFPTPRLRRFLWLYKTLWVLGLPLALTYLLWRSRRDPLYRQHLGERFGQTKNARPGAVWLHAVSLGELRSAVPLITRLLGQGEHIVITCFTPAGRRAALDVFDSQIDAGTVVVQWVPFEFRWCYTRFFNAFRPKYGLVMEIEMWPEMICAARAHAVRLFACNAQYPSKSFERDQVSATWRLDLMQGLAGAFVKSDLQQGRFHAAGCPNIHVTGELRFDQPMPEAQITDGKVAKPIRPTVTITSVVKGEDATYIALIKACPDILWVYVPRAPERFDETYDMLIAAGLSVQRRSALPALTTPVSDETNVLLGDSMGEMYYYLTLSDQALIGGSFVAKGAHNISEPLALGKPVVVGPHVWTIEFPIVEALTAGAATQVNDLSSLIAHYTAVPHPNPDAAIAFFATQKGAVDKTLKALPAAIKSY